MTSSACVPALPSVLAGADVGLVCEVYDRAVDGLTRVDAYTADERRGLLHDLYAEASANRPLCPAVR